MPLFKVTPAQYAGFLSVFNRSSSNGYLGRCELKALLERSGINATGAEVQQMIDCISVDCQGITFQAFIDLVSDYQSLRDVDNEYAEAFRLYDRTGSGKLTRDDITYVTKKLALNMNVDTMFKEMGKSDSIDYDDFVQLMKKKL
ncbi:hypothetical protein ScPMuIL_013545 [Solemya velum]